MVLISRLGGAMAEVRTLRLQDLPAGSAIKLAAIAVCLTLLWSVAKQESQTLSSLDSRAFAALLPASGADAKTLAPAPASSAQVLTNAEIGEWLGSAVLTVACHNR